MARRASSACLLAALLLALAGRDARAGGPVTLASGRVRVAGSASGTLGPHDDGFFNYSDYEQSTLRRLRLDVVAEARASDRVTLLADLRVDRIDEPRLHAAYVRLRPWPRRPFDLQAGRIPPVFGAFSRRAYEVESPLTGILLAYQYLTSLRADAVAASADQLAARRGFGWLLRYPVGSSAATTGLPLVSAERWDVGLQARIGDGPLSFSAALTQGTLGHPRIEDDNGGKQVAARLAWRPSPALLLGASAARGAYLARSLERALPDEVRRRTHRQHAAGLDVDYSRGHLLLRAEAVWSRWDMPRLEAPAIEPALDALGVAAEARYKIAPGLQVAARVDRLGFERIRTGDGFVTWDAPVERVEIGGSYALRRDLLIKLSHQWNWRDGGRRRSLALPACQLVYWF